MYKRQVIHAPAFFPIATVKQDVLILEPAHCPINMFPCGAGEVPTVIARPAFVPAIMFVRESCWNNLEPIAPVPSTVPETDKLP